MMAQTQAIIDILRGRRSGWAAQRRAADGLALRDALRLYAWHMVLGLGFVFAATLIACFWSLMSGRLVLDLAHLITGA